MISPAPPQPGHSGPSGLLLQTALLLVIALYLILVASGPDLDLFAETFHGRTFNSMAVNLLQGRFDVDPAAIGMEGVPHNGRIYAGFGILPAIARLPLMPFLDLNTTPVARLTNLAALLLGVAALLAAVRAVAPSLGAARAALVPQLCLLAVFGGPALGLAFRSSVFDEQAIWAWAVAMWFVAVALPGVLDPARFTAGRLCALAAFAGLALHTRLSTGTGLVATTLLLLAWHALFVARGPLWRRPFTVEMLGPLAVLALFFALQAGVNYGRWGVPVGMPLSQPMINEMHPDRPVRLATYGLFNLERVPYGLLYYFAPVWALSQDGRFLLSDTVTRLFDGFELPPASFLLTDPASMVLIALGLGAVMTGLGRRGLGEPALPVVAGLAICPGMMLAAWYMAFRYRVEFMPLFVVLAMLGAVHLARGLAAASRWARIAAAVLPLLVLAQVISVQAHALLYALSPFGPAHYWFPGDILGIYGRILRGS